jgi:hypothetical protein
MSDFRTAQIFKVDEAQGIAYGFAIVCKEVKDGQPAEYYDLQGDHIPEDAMLNAAAEFALGARVGKEGHAGDQVADVVFVFPMTEAIAKGLGITTDRFGLIIGYRPRDPSVLAKIKSGEYAGFSIGGERITDEAA